MPQRHSGGSRPRGRMGRSVPASGSDGYSEVVRHDAPKRQGRLASRGASQHTMHVRSSGGATGGGVAGGGVAGDGGGAAASASRSCCSASGRGRRSSA
eukprot:scaffold18865_cov57-Phaeocystis_antarctica.AAC.3